jgi:glycosyltransferase involved in cell wall biosynthesis
MALVPLSSLGNMAGKATLKRHINRRGTSNSMKVIALLPVRNERWILSAYLSSVKPIVDEIIALDDKSSDGSEDYLASNGVRVEHFECHLGPYPESLRQQKLLEYGRSEGGTHFVWLDADEALTAPFLSNAREQLSRMRPGDKIVLQWLALWKSIYVYRDDSSVWSNNYKDFIVCDHPSHGFREQFIHCGRTPGPTNEDNTIRLAPDKGAVLHFQFVPWHRFQVKQAYYRCLELVHGHQSPEEINSVYSITFDTAEEGFKEVPPAWLNGIAIPSDISHLPPAWHLDEILSWFDEYGITYFESLQIWHIPELRAEFLTRVGREPSDVLNVKLGVLGQKIRVNIEKIWRKWKGMIAER